MFTGIIDHCGIIISIIKNPSFYSLKIHTEFNDLIVGESIAVDGICLTVSEIHENAFKCDVSLETLNVTSAKFFDVNKKVNLERALQLSSRLGGHIVTGHIDQVAKIKSITEENGFIQMICSEIIPLNMNYLVKKGSIALNGVSLTLNEITENGFGITLIPHTLAKSNLSSLKTNDPVNIEFDMMIKIISEQMRKYIK